MSQHFNTDGWYDSWVRNSYFATGRRTGMNTIFGASSFTNRTGPSFTFGQRHHPQPERNQHPLDAEVHELVADCRKANGTRWQQYAFDLDDPVVLRAERLGLIEVEREFDLIRATKETA